jgi:hypothetical protein
MVDGDKIYAEFLLGLWKAHEISTGADICDRCGQTIWPEFELVRCDFCVGQHGAPSQERVQAAFQRHKTRIRQYQKEEWEAFGDA